MAKKPLEIDMCSGSQLRDTQGEMLSVEGADIGELEAGRGRLNDNHGKGFFNSVGRVTEAKKIFKAEDCDNDRHRYYWEKVKAPYIYVRGYLYDDDDHPNARAAAAILRNVHKTDCPLKLKASVEGGVVSRGISDPSLLARTKIHSVALTFTPANTATLVEPLNLDKSSSDEKADMILIESVLHLAQTEVPSFRHIVRDASATRVVENIEKIAELVKVEGGNIHVPSKSAIIQYALEAKVHSNVAKIKDVVREIKQDELEKGIKSAIAGAALAGATALAPSQTAGPQDVKQSAQVQQQQNAEPTVPSPDHQKAFQGFAKQNPLLGAIGMVESSGGANYKHAPINDPKSQHAGHTAGGMFGMMPNAAVYILHNDPKLAAKYPKLSEAAKDVNKNHTVFTETFNRDPQAAYDFADALMRRNKTKTRDINMLIHSWNHGLKGTWERYKNEGPEAIQDADYVQKVLGAYKKLQPHNAKKPAKNLKKALTAGYGGAGKPTDLGGGGVLQSEAMDDGRSFKYVTCDDCGKEQVYSKYQVKCRECGGSFPMEKLHKLFLGAIAT
jgi:hypothetical protein